MRSRLLSSVVTLPLLLAFFACSKPANTAEGNTPASPDQPANSAPAKAETRIIPAGTTLTVHLGQAVGSKISQTGQSFSATLARAVQVEGQELIPAGAKVSGTVADAQPLGHFKGGALLQLKLTTIQVNGDDQTIQTSSLVRTKKGKGKRTAVMVAGGGGAGALIGGLLGGGKGAAIGALAGAGAGTAGAAYTGNDEIVLPAESALSFKLTQPIQLQ